ncbi:MAG: glycosyltransferase family 4 protein [Owenweeksia sp.]
MIRVLFISRATLHSQAGGDTLQMEQTARFLHSQHCEVTIYRGEQVQEEDFDILHFFNLTRPADLLPFISWSVPKVISSIYIDYSEYDRKHRRGISRLPGKLTGSHGTEYFKTLARALMRKDRFPSFKYLLTGQKNSIRQILRSCQVIITASKQERDAITRDFNNTGRFEVIPLGIEHFPVPNDTGEKRSGVVCAARIEGLKNQLQLIRALKGSGIPLKLIGKAAENQPGYLARCRSEADSTMQFTGPVNRDELAEEFRKAKVHVLPSYYETTGLSTVEALRCGCQVVITKRGGQEEIFGDHAFYCDPDDPASIRKAIDEALSSDKDHSHWVQTNFSWASAAKKISDIYQSLLQNS